jgi:hypothetical protein
LSASPATSSCMLQSMCRSECTETDAKQRDPHACCSFAAGFHPAFFFVRTPFRYSYIQSVNGLTATEWIAGQVEIRVRMLRSSTPSPPSAKNWWILELQNFSTRGKRTSVPVGPQRAFISVARLPHLLSKSCRLRQSSGLPQFEAVLEYQMSVKEVTVALSGETAALKNLNPLRINFWFSTSANVAMYALKAYGLT